MHICKLNSVLTCLEVIIKCRVLCVYVCVHACMCIVCMCVGVCVATHHFPTHLMLVCTWADYHQRNHLVGMSDEQVHPPADTHQSTHSTQTSRCCQLWLRSDGHFVVLQVHHRMQEQLMILQMKRHEKHAVMLAMIKANCNWLTSGCPRQAPLYIHPHAHIQNTQSTNVYSTYPNRLAWFLTMLSLPDTPWSDCLQWRSRYYTHTSPSCPHQSLHQSGCHSQGYPGHHNLKKLSATAQTLEDI